MQDSIISSLSIAAMPLNNSKRMTTMKFTTMLLYYLTSDTDSSISDRPSTIKLYCLEF